MSTNNSKSATKTVAGYTVEQLGDLSMSALRNLSFIVEVNFPYFHFLKKEQAIEILVAGPNSPKTKQIIADKTKAMAAQMEHQLAALKVVREQQKKITADVEKQTLNFFLAKTRMVGNSLDLTNVPKQWQKKVQAAVDAGAKIAKVNNPVKVVKPVAMAKK